MEDFALGSGIVSAEDGKSETTIQEEEIDANFDSVSTIEENEQWTEALPFEETNFVGMPTYVDSEFNIYVQFSGRCKNIDNNYS